MITYYTLTFHYGNNDTYSLRVTLEDAIGFIGDMSSDTLERFIYASGQWQHIPREDVTRVELVRHSNDHA